VSEEGWKAREEGSGLSDNGKRDLRQGLTQKKSDQGEQKYGVRKDPKNGNTFEKGDNSSGPGGGGGGWGGGE